MWCTAASSPGARAQATAARHRPFIWLTIAAVRTAALLLPGIKAARVFFLAGQTREVEAP